MTLNSEPTEQPKSDFDPFAMARQYGEYLGIERAADESDHAYRSRVAGELHKQGSIIEAQEVASGRRWDDPEQSETTGPMMGIIGATALAMQGICYSPGDHERQISDEIVAGVVVTAEESRSEAAIGALFDGVGVSMGMDIINALHGNKP